MQSVEKKKYAKGKRSTRCTFWHDRRVDAQLLTLWVQTADVQPSTLEVLNFKRVLFTGVHRGDHKHSTEGIHRWLLWIQDGHGRLLQLLLRCPCLRPTLFVDSRYPTLKALPSAGRSDPLLLVLSWL